MTGDVIQSPFPHMQARAAADAAAADAKAKEEDQAREHLKSCCWRAGAFIMCVAAVAFTYHVAVDRRASGRLRFIWELASAGQSGDSGMVRRDASVPDKFFMEIGTSALESSVGGKHLENLGWNGVCAVPSQVELAGRTCKVVALPVGHKDGMQIHVPHCTAESNGIQRLMNKLFKVACPDVEATTVSIEKLLHIADAPKVIDYVALDKQEYFTANHSHFEVLQKFPFEERCVRAWSVNAFDANVMAKVSNLLEVSQGCKVHSAGVQLFARCPCAKFESSASLVASFEPANVSEIDILASGHAAHHNRKGSQRAAVVTPTAQ
jgi:hypothetical protein